MKRAIPAWDKEGYQKGLWGIDCDPPVITRDVKYFGKDGCCLAGASLLGVKSTNFKIPGDFEKHVWIVSGMSRKEVALVINVFDNGEPLIDKNQKVPQNILLIEEVLKIREILFPSSWQI